LVYGRIESLLHQWKQGESKGVMITKSFDDMTATLRSGLGIVATAPMYHPFFVATAWQQFLNYWAICLISFVICAFVNKIESANGGHTIRSTKPYFAVVTFPPDLLGHFSQAGTVRSPITVRSLHLQQWRSA
jgi:hypothetical protein